MDVFVAMGIIIVTLLILEACYTYNIAKRDEKKPPKSLLINWFARTFNWENIFSFICCCWNRVKGEEARVKPMNAFNAERQSHSNSDNSVFSSEKMLIATKTVSDRIIHSNETYLDEPSELTWVDLSHSVDVFSQILFSVGYALALIILFACAYTKPSNFF